MEDPGSDCMRYPGIYLVSATRPATPLLLGFDHICRFLLRSSEAGRSSYGAGGSTCIANMACG